MFIDAINPYNGLNIYNIILMFIIGVTIGIIAARKLDKEGGNMFGGHIHKWSYMYSNDANWDWFFCTECLAECCQTVNVNTGVVERHMFAPTVKKGGK